MDLRAQPRQRDPRRGRHEPRRRACRAVRHRPPLLRAEGTAARAAEALRLDRFAPLEGGSARIGWEDARGAVVDAFTGFAPLAGEIVDRFFERRWIDAALRPGKLSGAFCSMIVLEVHPYVFMNYAGERRSVLTLAHELGTACTACSPSRSASSTPGRCHARRDGVGLRRGADVREPAGARGRPGGAAPAPHRADRGRDRDHVPPDRVNRFEDALHTSRREEGRAAARAPGRTLARRAAAHPRRRGRGHRRLRHLVELHPALHRRARYVYAYAFGYLFALAIYGRYPTRETRSSSRPRPAPCRRLGAAGGAGGAASGSISATPGSGRPGQLDRGARGRGRGARRRARRLGNRLLGEAGGRVLVVAATEGAPPPSTGCARSFAESAPSR